MAEGEDVGRTVNVGGSMSNTENDWLKNIKRNKKIIVGITIYLLIMLLIFFYDQLIFYMVVLISVVLIEVLVVLYIVSNS